MVTLSVTRSRIAATLIDAAGDLEVRGWHPEMKPMLNAIDQAAGYTPGKGPRAAEALSFAAWDAISEHLNETWPTCWELERTQTEVVAMLRSVADEVTA